MDVKFYIGSHCLLFLKAIDEKLFFQGGKIKNGIFCIGISCGSTYCDIHSTKPISVQITKTGLVVNIDSWRWN